MLMLNETPYLVSRNSHRFMSMVAGCYHYPDYEGALMIVFSIRDLKNC